MDTLKERVYTLVDKMPEYPGGKGTIMRYISTHLRYPETDKEEGLQSRVVVRFIVTAKGAIANPQVLRRGESGLSKNIVELLIHMPPWIPGQIDGKAVPVYFTLPINVCLKE